MADKKRLTARKVRIYDIINGKYFYGSKEEMKPSFVMTSLGQKISRVNIVATVIDKFVSEDENYATLTIDDGTEAIRVKAFREDVKLINYLERGDLVFVIGKLKEYGGEVYINCEFAKKMDNFNYESFRRLEILLQLLQQKEKIEKIKELSEKVTLDELRRLAKEKFEIEEEILRNILEKRFEEDYKQKILELIRRLDTGEGVEVEKIFELCELPSDLIERAVDALLKEGSLYECFPGKFKVVG
ncbi:MAG: OB-fold nucleic acid binding domain-containing protein [Candidatus Aenigmarchaeota archaeon]|nr:OB-fold nucleic acid binding domain-containing protein [Candidatus Aenigmarchaeota archaeon]